MFRSQKTFLIFSSLAVILFASAFADDVVVLTEDNFEKEVGQDRGALVEFYAPWYVHVDCVLIFGHFDPPKRFSV